MNTPAASPQPLDQAELARLDELFEAINPGGAMVIEELDGFFTALVCGGDAGPATHHLDEILGVDDAMAVKYPSDKARDDLASLLGRHWRSIQVALADHEQLEPLLTEDRDDINPGNFWAVGFLRGIEAFPDRWDDLEEDTLTEWLEPFEALAEEIDFETGKPRLKIAEGEREQLLDEMFDTVFDAWQHFRDSGAAARH